MSQLVQENSVVVATPPALPVQAENDSTLLALWLNGRCDHTTRAYRADIAEFGRHVDKPLRSVTLADVQGFAASLGRLSPASQARRLGAVKSLFGFAARVGYVSFDAARPLRIPALKNVLAERILEEGDVVRLIAMEPNKRNHAMLRLLYVAGLRISEVCGLCWRDARRRDKAGQITVFGKGGKTRAVLLPAAMWKELAALRGEQPEHAPMFRSREGAALDVSQVHRIIKTAVHRAGLPDTVSAHWLRHCHVSHALDRGAPAHLVQATVGHADLKTTSRYSHARPSDSSARYLVG